MTSNSVSAPGRPEETTITAEPLAATCLEMHGISKRFGGHQALDGVSISLRPGQVLGLCGANGAGKSTLVKILAGVEHADAGRILLDGREVSVSSPRAASSMGLSFVHQELNLVPKFTALQNMAMGADSTGRLGVLDLRGLRARAVQVGEQLGYHVDLDARVDRLSVSDRWMVSLGRSLMREARIVAMDEPTASFTDDEVDRLFGVIRQLTSSGTAIIYVSHRLEEVLRISDEVTVLRDGRLVGTFGSDEITVQSLTNHIVGRNVDRPTAREVAEVMTHRPVRLRATGLRRLPLVQEVDLHLHEGEILGIAGLVGSGRTELARLLVGADAPTAGTMILEGRPYAPRSPHHALRRGVGLVPEERRSEGLALRESIQANVAMAAHGRSRWLLTPHWPGRAKQAARAVIERFRVAAESVSQPVHSLSGGNQQKVVVGRYVQVDPSVLVLDEPTVGVDVGARAEIYDIIRSLAADGTSVVVICSDFDELAVCHRVLVLREGRVVAEVPGHKATKSHLTALCFAHEGEIEPAVVTVENPNDEENR